MISLLPIVLTLALAYSSFGNTLIIPVKDLLMEIPQFRNAPRFNLNDSFYGRPIGEGTKQERVEKKKLETELIQFMWTEFPEAKAISIWNGNLIIKL